MRTAIVGGTGTVGAKAAREVERRGHEVRVLSRHAPEHPVDLSDGSGLAAALDGVDAVVTPVDPREVGRVLAETAEAEPLLAIAAAVPGPVATISPSAFYDDFRSAAPGCRCCRPSTST
jgi:uncharacterized protein YbjT (DUF2867 family)